MAELPNDEIIRTPSPHEQFWIDHQQFLLSRGYLLRPRFRLGWVPSWTLSGSNFDPKRFNIRDFEDAVHEGRRNVLDAIRLSDGVKVVLKRIQTRTPEIGLGVYFNSPELLKHPHNRTYRLLDIIPLSDDDDFAIIVMPFLREFGTPVFRRLQEVVEAMRQFLQGLKFMHDHNVAHRDACAGNMVMDATRVIPGGYHFSQPWTENGVDFGVYWRARSFVSPVEYYFIDFGLSDYCPDGPEATRDVGVFGQDKTVPELSDTVPYNPFKVDVYQLGNAFADLVKKYPGMHAHFGSLAASMTRRDPYERPSASQTLSDFEDICSNLTAADLTSRLHLRPRVGDEFLSGEEDSDYELVSGSESSASSNEGLGDPEGSPMEPHDEVLDDVESLRLDE
ncbi:kinase-like domain-containing protein [Mycena vitilis]|nr:kinase-like domain-containing protein [Mycena vitilis]